MLYRAVTLAVFFACASFVSSEVAPAPAPSSYSKSAVVEKRLALGTLDTLLLWDHFFTKRSTVISPNYLSRLADPHSPLHAEYLAYTQGTLTRSDLISALPHVAVVGDSLTKNLYISPAISLIWRARTEQQRNWFLDTDSSPRSIYSLYERIDKLTPVVVSDYARGAAEVTAHPGDEILAKTLARTRNFTGQVDQILKQKRFPDLVLIWIGHNNLNWVKGMPEAGRNSPAGRLSERAQAFHEDYARQLRRLIERAEAEDHRVAIVTFGLADCQTFFRARNEAGALHAENPRLYPYFDICAQRFESLKPPYQANMIVLGSSLNRELRGIVADFNKELEHHPNVRLQYSDALAQIDLSNLELIHPMDGQHLSAKGHNRVAEQAFTAIAPSLSFLRIGNEVYAANPTSKAH
jgi:lysophospholipase L1-like esterase